MPKQQQLSPESYIRTRARTLPIDACYINAGWETAGLATVVVLRRHVNGNITSAVYMVDLLCRGIKDSLYFFNQPLYELEEKFDFEDSLLWQKIDYDLAHNIVYAGHDFAMDFHIEPHKGFAVTKYILEEDNDNVPLIEIETGDKDGKPHLMVNTSDSYGDVLAKLKKYAGEGNYTFTIASEPTDWENEENKGEEEEDDDDYVDDQETEMFEDTEDEYLDNIELGFFDFKHVSEISTSKLLEVLINHKRLPVEDFIIKAELLMRLYNEKSSEIVVADENEVIESPAYKMYKEGEYKWNEAYETSKSITDEMSEKVLNLQLTDKADENAINNCLSLIDNYSESEFAVLLLLQATPPVVIIKMYDELLKRFDQHSLLVQLIITALGLVLEKENIEQFRFILSAENVEDTYPADMNIHSLHHKFFWFVKALHALNLEDEKSLWQWHNLIAMTGIGGSLKFLYAMRLESWLREKVNFHDTFMPANIFEGIDSRL